MGLYLCIFDGDEEVDGVEVGPYADFNALRSYIARTLEDGRQGARFPTLNLHSDSDGEWTVGDCAALDAELSIIISAMKTKPAENFVSEWQKRVARYSGVTPQNALESFIDVDGEFVLERIHNLVKLALQRKLPILFQ